MSSIDPFIMQLRNRRLDLGLTQLTLSGLSEVHFSKISGYETGKLSPSLRSLRRLADALGCDIRLQQITEVRQ